MTKSEKYEKKFQIVEKVTKEQAERFGIKEGAEIILEKMPSNWEEAWDKFVNYDAQKKFEAKVIVFERQFGINPDKNRLEAELKKIEDIISEAGKLDYDKAFQNESPTDQRYEYVRLAKNYYTEKPKTLTFKPNHSGWSFNNYFNSGSALVYARYFLFRDWLRDQLQINKRKAPGRNQQTLKFEDFILEAKKKTYIKFKDKFIKEHAHSSIKGLGLAVLLHALIELGFLPNKILEKDNTAILRMLNEYLKLDVKFDSFNNAMNKQNKKSSYSDEIKDMRLELSRLFH